MKTIKLPHRLDVFYLTARHGSFTQAANVLDITSSMVSQHVAKLEDELGAKLLNRTTRRLSLTLAGEQLFNTCRDVFDRLDQGLSEIHQIQSEPAGHVVVNAQTDFGEKYIIPLSYKFMQIYPKITVDIQLDDEVRDLQQNQIDVSFTLGKLRDSNYRAIKLGDFETILCASSGYLKKHTQPNVLSDLHNHHYVLMSAINNPRKWAFRGPGNTTEKITLSGGIMTNSSQGLQAFVKAGAGIAILPEIFIRDSLRSGDLKRVLPQHCLPAQGIYAVYSDRQRLPFCVRTFIDFIKKEYKNDAF
jgi:DNA-binding transcriptional LysR family regulator